MPRHAQCRVDAAVTLLEPPRDGLWCPRCALPSGSAGIFAVELDGQAVEVLRHAECLDCGACLNHRTLTP